VLWLGTLTTPLAQAAGQSQQHRFDIALLPGLPGRPDQLALEQDVRVHKRLRQAIARQRLRTQVEPCVQQFAARLRDRLGQFRELPSKSREAREQCGNAVLPEDRCLHRLGKRLLNRR
jgi:hypothetical protein